MAQAPNSELNMMIESKPFDTIDSIRVGLMYNDMVASREFQPKGSGEEPEIRRI
jgi:hypothetical protein